jgi:hypothetical protein
MGGARDALKVFLRRRVKPPVPGKPGAFIPDAIQGANAVLGLVQAGRLSGLLVVAVRSLISSGSGIVAMVPDKINDPTGPSGAMVVHCERDVVLLQVPLLAFLPSDRPSAENHLIPPDTGLAG